MNSNVFLLYFCGIKLKHLSLLIKYHEILVQITDSKLNRSTFTFSFDFGYQTIYYLLLFVARKVNNNHRACWCRAETRRVGLLFYFRNYFYWDYLELRQVNLKRNNGGSHHQSVGGIEIVTVTK